MELGQAMTQLINKLLVVVGTCPECQADLYQWRQKLPSGADRCGPTCMSCGHRELKKKQDYDTIRAYNDSLKKRAINYLKYSSLIPDKSLLEKSLKNYKVVDDETRNALETAKRAVTQIVMDKPAHFVLSGKSGTGKSHLAMAVAWSILEKSNYQKKVLFVNYRELLEQLQFAMGDEQARKAITGNLMSEIKTTDLVVIDDIGAELGGLNISNSSRYNNDILSGILEARQNMATVITTNLTSEEIRRAYGERVLSRILQNSKNLAIVMKNTLDKRKHELIG